MRLVDITLETPEENLALDEALLQRAEAGEAGGAGETLRFWEPSSTMVVAGRGSDLATEVHLQRCLERSVPVLRRPSGGAAVVTGPGCLMYAVILSLDLRPRLRGIDGIHAEVLDRHAAAVARHVPGACRQGISDLAIGDRKFSGNSLRLRRRWALYHGTILYNFELPTVELLLQSPPRQPKYRAGRSHSDFLTNLPLTAATIRQAIADIWNVENSALDLPLGDLKPLLRDKYLCRSWHDHAVRLSGT